jgi:hypothetical protein
VAATSLARSRLDEATHGGIRRGRRTKLVGTHRTFDGDADAPGASATDAPPDDADYLTVTQDTVLSLTLTYSGMEVGTQLLPKQSDLPRSADATVCGVSEYRTAGVSGFGCTVRLVTVPGLASPLAAQRGAEATAELATLRDQLLSPNHAAVAACYGAEIVVPRGAGRSGPRLALYLQQSEATLHAWLAARWEADAVAPLPVVTRLFRQVVRGLKHLDGLGLGCELHPLAILMGRPSGVVTMGEAVAEPSDDGSVSVMLVPCPTGTVSASRPVLALRWPSREALGVRAAAILGALLTNEAARGYGDASVTPLPRHVLSADGYESLCELYRQLSRADRPVKWKSVLHCLTVRGNAGILVEFE